ncbi:MAG: prephenate dehydrogenase/arogenate dehydrogenase family protein [Candidatus Omnitrophica bacterium]|nr:prephenate dehydrogenase/arogenate dehydrogenase family protein [Candidatus Omnitrophota bacterium]
MSPKRGKPVVAIVGMGLIGGSLGLAIRKARIAREVVGICRRPSSIAPAIRMGACDRGTIRLKQGIDGADLIFLCTPPQEIMRLARVIARQAEPGVVVTDVGSTKSLIVRNIESGTPDSFLFVGGHPLAGSEQAGLKASRPGLFRGATWILTRSRRTSPKAIASLAKFLSKLRVSIAVMSPQEHDEILALTSHLPHAVAGTLAGSLKSSHLRFAAGGFKDVTRIASSDPNLWGEIFLSNRHEVADALSRFRLNLGQVERWIRRGEGRSLVRFLVRARALREKIHGIGQPSRHD